MTQRQRDEYTNLQVYCYATGATGQGNALKAVMLELETAIKRGDVWRDKFNSDTGTIAALTAENTRMAERATGAESRSLEMAQSIAELDKELFDTSRRAEAAEARVIELETALNDIIERDPEYFQRLIEDDEALAAALAEQGDAVVPRG